MRPASLDPEEDSRLKKERHEKDLLVLSMLEAKGFGVTRDELGGVKIQRYLGMQKSEE